MYLSTAKPVMVKTLAAAANAEMTEFRELKTAILSAMWKELKFQVAVYIYICKWTFFTCHECDGFASKDPDVLSVEQIPGGAQQGHQMRRNRKENCDQVTDGQGSEKRTRHESDVLQRKTAMNSSRHSAPPIKFQGQN